MRNVRIADKTEKFVRSSEAAFDKVLSDTAIDIIRLSKLQVPHDQGTLSSSGRFERKGIMHFEISYNKPYARRWEFETPSGGFKRGRKSRYLRDPADMLTKPEVLSPKLRAAANLIGSML